MRLETDIEFRKGTNVGAVLDPAGIIQILAGAYPGHPRVVVTGVRYRLGAPRCEPIEGCYAVAYPSVEGQYPLVSASCAVMADAATEGLMDDCRALADRMARWAWHLICCGEAHVIPERTPYGLSLRPAPAAEPPGHRGAVPAVATERGTGGADRPCG